MKKINYLLLSFLFVTLFACNSNNNNSTEEDNNNSTEEDINHDMDEHSQDDYTEEDYALDFKVTDGKFEDIENSLYKGDIVALRTWEDLNGYNYFVVSIVNNETPETDDSPVAINREIHGYHYIATEGGPELIREIKDFETDCIFDNRLAFDEKYLSLVDLDGDNYGEICFLYSLGCTSELSPDGVKLMYLENGDKYAIRGNTFVDYGYEGVGGEKNVDGNFKSGPKVFLDYANEQWDNYMLEHNFYSDNGGGC